MFDPNKKNYVAVEVNKDLANKSINDIKGRIDPI